MKDQIKIFISESWADYELLDTGGGEKLERLGKYTFVRPYEDAVWDKTLGADKWRPDARFITSREGSKAGWRFANKIPEGFVLERTGIKWKASPTPFRHFGFFPEQASHWDFIESKIKNAGRPIKFLNLFGYTGIASLYALRAGAEVTHVDASRQSLTWAKENQKLNPRLVEGMRIIAEDALKFLERESKRGNRYDAIIMDPPKFGRGPKGEIWKLEEKLPKLLAEARNVLSDQPLFLILNSYAVNSSSLSLGYALEEAMKARGGKTEAGELCLKESSTGRAIPIANAAIWSA
ncbi:MAG TPA: class I SAM-dependent methyltransferase [Candidatus Paceibacterota bacterium]|nr:class I SAM-dependent methyltransferase [Candidatus Paceibacterota bacterium]